MRHTHPSNNALNVGLSTPPGTHRLKAHLVAGPNAYLSSYHRPHQSGESSNQIPPVPRPSGNLSFGLSSSGTPDDSNLHSGTSSASSCSRTGNSVSNAKMTLTVQSSLGNSTPGQPRADQLVAFDKPSAPLPIRRHHNRTPPIQLQSTLVSPTSAHQNSHRPLPEGSVPTTNPSRQISSHFTESAFARLDGNSARNSSRTTDQLAANSPPRSARRSAFAVNSLGQSAPSSARELPVQQATVVRAPTLCSADSFGQRNVHGQVSVPLSDQSSMSSSDCSSKMTITELRSFAERQRQLLTRQAHQLQVKEERLAWLRSLRSQTGGGLPGSVLPPPGAQLNMEQEKCLHKFRNLRGQTEQTRLKNESLVTEIDLLSRSLSLKEVELEACRQRAEDAVQALSLLDSCHAWLAKGKTLRSMGKLESVKPLQSLSLHLPFNSDKDKRRWHDGLLEADRLDRQIAQALNHNAQSKRSHRTGSDQPAVEPSSSARLGIHVSNASDVPGVSTTNTNAIPASSSHGLQLSGAEFSSLLSRASSPPTNRRSSLRMLLHAAAAASGDSQTISGFPRLKTPPRYASRAVINDTYMRKICMDSVEKYKKTASEIYRANVERMHARQQQSGSESDKSSTELSVSKDALEPGEVKSALTEVGKLPASHSVGRASPADSVSSSSSSSTSSLELIGIEHAGESTKASGHDLSPTDEDTKHTVGDVDSGLGGSDDTGQSEHVNAPSPMSPSSAHRVTVYVDDSPGTDASLSNVSYADGGPQLLKPILRKSVGKIRLTKEAPSTLTETGPLSVSSPSKSNSVRFHPLALLLDAALEGDFDLVKEVASQVSDVSEPNDEGITALHNAVCAGRTEIAEYLVRVAGADVNAGDTDGWTPLHCAASCGNLPLARLLVEHGASLHARTLSDQETPLEKCDQGDDEAECEEYLFFQQERLGSAASGVVYALFPRGLEAAGPGSPDAQLQSDELAVYPNEQLRIIDREPAGETEWMLAEKSDGSRGLIPRSHISCYPLVRVPPASRPVPLLPPKPQPFLYWDDEGEDEQVISPSPHSHDSHRSVIEVELPNSDATVSTDSSSNALPLASMCRGAIATVDFGDKNPTDEEEKPDMKTAL